MDNFRTKVGKQDLLVALDGTWYFSSGDIHCSNCLRKTHEGEKTYYHAMINPVIAVPGKTQVIPLPPEFIKNSDGDKKQDCEQNGAKRWIKKYGKKLSKMRVTILGDDLYAHQPICDELLASGFNFNFFPGRFWNDYLIFNINQCLKLHMYYTLAKRNTFVKGWSS